MAGNPSFDDLLTSTLHNYVSKQMEDNIFRECRTLNAIRAKSGIVKKGGDTLLMPLRYAANTTVKSLGPYDPFDTTPQEGITCAEYSWANFGGTVVIDNLTVDVMNAGESKVIDLLEEKITQLELSMVEFLNTQLWASPGRSDAWELWSLYDVCNCTDSDTFTDPAYTGDGVGYGNISIANSQNTWWRPMKYYDDGNSAPTARAGVLPIADDALSIPNLNHIYYACSNGSDTPDLIVMQPALYEKFESLLIATNRAGPDEALTNAGIDHLKLHSASVIYDESLTGNDIFFLNTKYLKLVVARDMQASPFQTPPNQDVRVSRIVWSGQLGCSNRARQGCWADVDVA